MNCQVLPSTDGDWGEVHDYIIKDAITQARWELQHLGPKTAMRNIGALRQMVDRKTWRSAEAADTIARITRMALEIEEAVIEKA